MWHELDLKLASNGTRVPFERCDLVFKLQSDMNATTVAIALAKSVFQLAVTDEHWHVVETQRLTRAQFER